MANWIFTTPVVAESPFAWNPLHERFRMDRGITLVEVSPCVYEQVRYDAYTNELGAANLPPVQGIPSTGLKRFRGGYEWVVDDATKACLIASGNGVTESNFGPPPGGYGYGGYGSGVYGG